MADCLNDIFHELRFVGFNAFPLFCRAYAFMIEQAMQCVTGDMTITLKMMAAQGGYSGSGVNNGELISGINTALNTALAGGSSAEDIVIPVYIGGDMIDEIVVTAQQRMNLRSGGR